MKFLKDIFSNSDIGVWLSLGAFVGYGIYYAFAVNFNKYYNLSFKYIDFNLQSFAFTVLIVTMLVIILFAIIETPLFFKKLFPSFHIKNEKTRFIIQVSLSLIVWIMILVGSVLESLNFNYFTMPWLYWIQVIGYSGLIGIVCYCLKSFRSISMLLSIVGYFILLAFMTGSFFAINKSDYLVLNGINNQQYVVINTYEDQFIIAPVNLKKKLITPKFQFIEMKSEENKKVELNLMHTGKLEVKEYAN